MRYIKYMPDHSIQAASRNRREISVALEQGFSVTIFSDDKQLPEELGKAGVELIYDGKYLLNPRIPKLKRIFCVLYNYCMIFYRSCKLQGDIWSCHDLSSLGLAWFVTRLRKNKPKLIYDSHEFTLGLSSATQSKRKARSIAFWENFLMKRCTFSIMVNDSIADEVQHIHGLKERPVVVRSTPDYWHIDESVCAIIRKELLSELGYEAENEDPFLLMYHGALLKHRGIETDIRVAAKNPHICVIILGNGSESYVAELKKLAEELGVSERILFHSAVPIAELWKYVGAVDLSMVMIEAVVKNHYYSLPNKFFESIQSLTPLVTSNFPELKRIVKQYGIGMSCNPEDLDAVSACVERMRTDKEFYAKCKENLKRAKEELCWENEKQVLIEAYKHKIK